jgi:hypothetical protein
MSQDDFRREPGAQPILSGKRDAANSFENGTFPSGLVATYDQLGQCNMIANPVGADTVDLVEALRRPCGLEAKFVSDPAEVNPCPLFFRTP